MMLSDTDCDLRVHDSMDGASNAIGHVDRAGAGDLAGVHVSHTIERESAQMVGLSSA